MHMSDALISPAVGIGFGVISLGLIGYAARKIKDNSIEYQRKAPLMGVLGAFVFAGQMINFAIPGTGASGHLGGALLLALLLGPAEGFITITSILVVQSLFFADGGILALGCNIVNNGFWSSFVLIPVFRMIGMSKYSDRKQHVLIFIAAIVALQMGSFGVVTQTFLSGKSDISLGTFLMVMQPIHLAIGVGEGLVTVSLLLFLKKVYPNLGYHYDNSTENSSNSRLIGAVALILSIALGGSLYASSNPDGLEWSIEKSVIEEKQTAVKTSVHSSLEEVQEKSSFFPDYTFKESKGTGSETFIAGVIGGGIVLLLLMGSMVFFMIRKRISLKT